MNKKQSILGTCEFKGLIQNSQLQYPFHLFGNFFAVQTCNLKIQRESYTFPNNFVTVLKFAVFRQCVLRLSKSCQTSSLFVFCMRDSSLCASYRNHSSLHGRILILDYKTFFGLIVTCISSCHKDRVITITGQVR